MINLCKDNIRGVTLVTLSIAIIIMLIITSTLIYNITTGNKVKALNNMYYDITKIKDKVDLYYINYHTIPTLEIPYENVSHIQNMNPNDNEIYYVIDLESLDNMNLNYGQDYKKYQMNPSSELTDLYVINEKSHSIYYIKGIQFDNKIYYTIPDLNTKVELNSIANIEHLKIDRNISVLKLNASNKENGIKQIRLMINGEEYKTYEYTSHYKEIKEEVINITLEFGKEYVCYFEIIDEVGTVEQSNSITIQNRTTIATVEDLQNLATLVNEGKDIFTKQTVELINDLDLNGKEDNQWTPIGNEENNFCGVFEGNGHTIYGLYINQTEKQYNGLFGYIGEPSTVIQNLNVVGTIKTTQDYAGGIAGYNKGIIKNCTTNIKLETVANFTGDIVGQNDGGQLLECKSQKEENSAEQNENSEEQV